jgi:hypothetical protein
MSATHLSRFLFVFALALASISIGCAPPEKAADKAEENAQDNLGSILGKSTQKIGEWDPEANRQVRDDSKDINIVNRTRKGASSAINQIATMQIQQAVNLFNAAEGRYPKSHEEFMEKVIKANNIRLPEPVTSCEYQYDVENHELKLVEKQQ